MIVDTGSPVTILQGDAGAKLQTSSERLRPPRRQFDCGRPAVASLLSRARSPLRSCWRPPGTEPCFRRRVLGADLLRGYSVAFRFGAPCTTAGGPDRCASMTFWNHLGADEGFLEDAGYAVYRFSPYGGGEVNAEGPADFLGSRGPLVLAATRIVLRTCAVPAPFAPADPVVACCSAKAAEQLATGVNLSLLLATGIGPVVLSRSAFDRVAPGPRPSPLPAPTAASASLFVASWPVPIVAAWSALPRLAFVDLEAGGANDPGACVELGRARRTEQVSFQRVAAMPTRRPMAFASSRATRIRSSRSWRNRAPPTSSSAAPSRWPSSPTTSRSCRALRADVRPEGPELDGLVGAGALRAGARRARLPVVAAASGLLLRDGRHAATSVSPPPAVRGCRTPKPSTTASASPRTPCPRCASRIPARRSSQRRRIRLRAPRERPAPEVR